MKDEKFLIETERLKLISLSIEDLPMLKKLLKDPEIMYFSTKGTLNDEEIEKFLKEILENQKKFGFGACSVINKKTKEWLGFCRLWLEKDKDNNKVLELGYRFFKKYWNKGYATEAVRVLVDYLKKKFPNEKMFVYISLKNKASIRMAEKVGMKFIGNTIYHGVKVNKYRI